MKGKTPTKIGLIIQSEFEHTNGDLVENISQQIEIAVFHLQTLFNLSKHSATHLNAYLEDEDGEIEAFLSDVRNASDLGFAVTMSILKAVSELPPMPKAETEQPEKILGANKTAERLEQLLNSDDTPDALKDALNLLLDAESFERSLTFNDSRIVRQSFPLLLETISENGGGDSARVFLSAIENLIDSFPCVKKSEVSH